jgi:hypothetical protein
MWAGALFSLSSKNQRIIEEYGEVNKSISALRIVIPSDRPV